MNREVVAERKGRPGSGYLRFELFVAREQQKDPASGVHCPRNWDTVASIRRFIFI